MQLLAPLEPEAPGAESEEGWAAQLLPAALAVQPQRVAALELKLEAQAESEAESAWESQSESESELKPEWEQAVAAAPAE